ncbi:MAG: hypothetical protein Ct9H300mP2_0330 [Candidatus Neomarinimicrobiota bacterium]|nr:MAG: hypothetical protein Ct9H300mP2_0330 [Candidatus Neomarinimicrobiota bacterium]
MTREDFMKRVDLQWTDEDKAHMADYIISNNNSLEDLKKMPVKYSISLSIDTLSYSMSQRPRFVQDLFDYNSIL